MAKKQKSAITQDAPSIASMPTSKKISFFSAMLIVMGSSIGAGIFFKAKGVLESSQGSLVFAILAWLIAAFAVIAMALALIEVASARNDNLSLIGWCKVFNSRSIYKASKNFMFYIYLPLTYFFMPFYVIMSLQDAIGAFTPTGQNTFMLGGTGEADWVIWFLVALVISIFFIFVSGMSSKAGDIMNKGIMAVKFIPLVATILIGFIIAGMDGANVSAGPITPPITNDAGDQINPDNPGGISSVVDPTNLGYMTPGIGLFMAIGAIFFAYDGFYVTAGIQSEMKEPKKTPLAILFGLGAVTIIYLLIAIAMSITGNGGLFGFYDFLESHNVLWVFGTLNLMIAIGVLGIINGFAMWAPRFTEDLIKEHELPLSRRFINRLNPNRPMIGIYYSLVITIPVLILFTIIGALAYRVDGYGLDYGSQSMSYLYTFCDLTGTWTAVFAFMFIMLPIFGALKNRKEHFVHTEQKKYFVPFAWVSIIVIGIVLALLFLDAFVNVFMLINIALPGEVGIGYKEQVGGTEGIVGRIMKLITLFIFVGLMVIPTFIEDTLHKRQYGSIEAYERALGIEPTTKSKVAV